MVGNRLLFLSVALSVFAVSEVKAQLVPDRTLGRESSIVNPVNNLNDRIDGGAVRGENLFHSFLEFNVGEGRGVDFTNLPGIVNILTRVTGSNSSNILGRLGVLGEANLFLINPNGIVFGENASLDIGGSFVATTANEIKLGADGLFSATDPQSSNLLSVRPEALFFTALHSDRVARSNERSLAGKILVRGPGNNLIFNGSLNERPVGLKVNPGRTLAMVGGEILLEGGNLTAPDGRIELGSVQGVGLVKLIPIDSGFVLGYEGVKSFQDISFTQAASAVVSGSVGGSIRVQGRRVSLTDGSTILVDFQGSGEGGGLNVTASESVRIIGTTADNNFNSSLLAETRSTGKGGDIKITTPILLLEGGGQVSTSSYGPGQGGNLIVNASESVQVIGIGVAVEPIASAIGSQAGDTGNGGNITINTRRLIVRDGGFVGGGAFGAGDGPNVTINASESIELIGTTGILDLKNAVICGVQGFCQGEIPSGLLADSFAGGNGGNFTINTRNLIIRDGAQVSVSTAESGKGGNLTVNASESVQLIGRSNPSAAAIPIGISANGKLISGLFATSGKVGFFPPNPEATGEGGNLIINSEKLIIRDGAQINVSTFGEGKAGNLSITAQTIELIGTDPIDGSSSGLFSATEGTGEGGNLFIKTSGLKVTDGAVISASTGEEGKAGNLTITAQTVELIGINPVDGSPSGLFANTRSDSTGFGGNITVNTTDLQLANGSQIAANSFGQGNAGTIAIEATRTVNANNGQITTSAANATGGAIEITAENIRLRGDSDITTNVANGTGNGGNITLNAGSIIAFDDSDILAFARDGIGGDITLNTPAFFGSSYAPTLSGINPFTLDGNGRVDVNATGAINGSIIAPDVSFISYSLANLPETQIDTSNLIAKTCIERRTVGQESSFSVTGGGTLPERPGQVPVSDYPAIEVQSVFSSKEESKDLTIKQIRPWHLGDPIVEATGVRKLSNGRLILSSQCSQ